MQAKPSLEVTKKSENIQKKIPMAVFMENIEEVCKKHNTAAVMQSLDEAYNKYKLIESQLVRSNESMTLKIPEIEKALDIIGTLRKQKEVSVDFLLADSLWVKAKGTTQLNKIAIWLGANTMVEMTFDEAEKMLRDNLANAKSNLKEIQEDLNYVKDQVTTSEVNIARVYNHSLMEKRLQEGKSA